MPYGIIYRLQFKESITEQVVQVNICKTSTFDPGVSTTYIDCVGAESPIRISVIDNNRDKLTPIRAKVAEINIIPTDDAYAEIFATGPDNEWFVDAFVVTTNYRLFKGYLVMDDHQKPFLPTSHKQPFKLTATDQLGTLKDIELKDLNGDRIDDIGGMHSLLDYVLFALKPTGLDLNVVICSTWFEESQTVFECAWQNIYPSHKAFEERQANEKVDCYTALEMILKTFCCTLFQRNGKWWIRSIDEPTYGTLYGFEYDWDGTFVQQITSNDYVQTIGRIEDIYFINKDQLFSWVRPHKETAVEMDYALPSEIVDNIDLSRGLDDLTPILVEMGHYIASYANLGAFPAAGQSDLIYKANDTSLYYRWNGATYEQVTGSEVPTGTAYVADDWTIGRYSANTPTTVGASTSTAYIAKIFQYGEEKGRYLVVTFNNQTNPLSYLRSNPVPVGRLDRGSVSVDFRFNKTTVGNNVTVMGLVLEGNSGSNYAYSAAGVWIPATNFGSANFAAFGHNYANDNAAKIQWQTVGTDMAPFPESGNFYIFLLAGYNHAGTGNPDVHYSNLQFNYNPYINGSHQKYSGHINSVTQTGEYKAVVTHTPFFGDSPRPLFKNSLFKLVGSQYLLTQRWYAAGDLLNNGITPPIPDASLNPLGKMQAYALWNQYNRQMGNVSGSMMGLRLNTLFVPDLLERYTISAAVTEAQNKQFTLASCDQDIHAGTWSATLLESFDTVLGHEYPTTHTFKYKGGTP